MKVRTLIILLICANINLNAQTYGWYTVPGAPVSGRFEDISFINDSTGFIGQDNKIYKTSDRGDTWVQVYNNQSGPLSYVRSLDFVNDTLGFAGILGGNESLYMTHNGGLTWFPIDSLISGSMTGICGLDHRDSMIVAVGSVNGPAYVCISKDWGKNWTYQSMAATNGYLIDCFIMDSLNILVSGTATLANNYKANILRTNNGGLTWQQVALSSQASTYAWKIFMQDNGIGVTSNESFTDGLFFKTLDSGYTWQEFPLTGSSVINIGGIAILNDTLLFTGDQHTPGMAYSVDGGASWSDLNAGNASDRMYVFDDNTAICTGITIYKYHPDSVVVTSTAENIRPQHVFELRSNDQINYTLHVNLYQKTKLMVELFTIDGRYIRQPINDFYSKGDHDFVLDLEKELPGGYFLRLRTYEYLSGVKFVKK